MRSRSATFQEFADAELLGVKRIIGAECFCAVSPQTAESVTVRFVVPLSTAAS